MVLLNSLSVRRRSQAKAAMYSIVLILFIFIFVQSPLYAQLEGDVGDTCGEGIGTCMSGLTCSLIATNQRECRGWINYPTTNRDDCAKELIVRNGKCQLDLGEGVGEQLNIGETTQDFRSTIVKVVNIALGFVAIIGVVVIMYAGWLWMSSAGREEQVEKAKQTILWSVAGLIVITLAWTITSYILSLGQQIGGAPGGRRGAQNGGLQPFPPGGFVEEFTLNEVVGKGALGAAPNADLFQCSSLDALFNRSVDDDSFRAALQPPAVQDTLRVALWDDDDNPSTQEDYNGLQTKTWPADVNDGSPVLSLFGSHVEYKHFVSSECSSNSTCVKGPYLFNAGAYSLIVPRDLRDLSGKLLTLCKQGLPGCQVFQDIIAWDFTVGNETDTQNPEVISVSPYYDKRYYEELNAEERQNAVPAISRDVQQGPTIVITFSEPILASSLFVADQENTDHADLLLPAPLDIHTSGTLHPLNGKFLLHEIEAPTDEELKSVPPAVRTVDFFPETPEVVDAVPNVVFRAFLDNSNRTVTLSAMSADPKFLLKNNTWYRISLSGVQDLCGRYLAPKGGIGGGSETIYILFQVNGLAPNLYETPSDGMQQLCTNIKVGVSSTVSMRDPRIEPSEAQCAVGTGYVSGGTLWYTNADFANGEELRQADEAPGALTWVPDTRTLELEVEGNQEECTLYNFKGSDLQYAKWYKAYIDTRYPKPEGGMLQAAWYFKTATSEKVVAGECNSPPIINRIRPVNGPKGACITVEGENFGAALPAPQQYGLFITPKGGEDIAIEQPVPPNPEAALLNVILNSWTNTEIVATIPIVSASFTPFDPTGVNGNPITANAEHPVRVVLPPPVGTYMHSRPYAFRLDYAAVPSTGPCLGDVEPNLLHRDLLATLTGIRFGSASGEVHYESRPDTIFTSPGEQWLEGKIVSLVLKEEISATGKVDVKVKTQLGGMSNPMTRDLLKLSPVSIHPRGACDPYISPNPQENQGKDETTKPVCILQNGNLSYIPVHIEFDYDITGSGSAFADSSNYSFYTCSDFDTCGATPITPSPVGDLQLRSYRVPDVTDNPNTPIEEDIHSAAVFTFSGDALAYNTVYKIEMKNIIDDYGIATPANFSTRSWKFKTIADEAAARQECQTVSSVTLTISPDTIQHPARTTARAEPMNDRCQPLPGLSFSWSANPSEVARIPSPGEKTEGTISIDSLPVPDSDPDLFATTAVSATEVQSQKTSNSADLTVIHESVCRPSQGEVNNPVCVKNGCTGSICAVVDEGRDIGRCTPFIKSLYGPIPENSAGPNDWVTVSGCYLGTDLIGSGGSVLFSKPEGPAVPGVFDGFPPICLSKAWTSTRIVVAIPSNQEGNLHDDLAVGAASVKVRIPEMASNVYNNQYQANIFSLVESGSGGPKLCAIENATEDSRNPCYNGACGKVNEDVFLYGKDFDIDDPPSQGNEKAEFRGMGAQPTDGLAVFTIGGAPVEPSDTGGISSIPTELPDDTYNVRALDGPSESRKGSNAVPFQIGDPGRAKVLLYKPNADSPFIRPCSDTERGTAESALPSERKFCASPDAKAHKPYNGGTYISFDKVVKCLGAMTTCIAIRECTNQQEPEEEVHCFGEPLLPNASYSFKEGNTKIEFNNLAGDAFKIGHRYRIAVQPSSLVTEVQEKKTDCGTLARAFDDTLCYWDFTLQKNLEVGSIEVTSSGIGGGEDDDALINLNTLDKLYRVSRYDPDEKLKATVYDTKEPRVDITDDVRITWTIPTGKGLEIVIPEPQPPTVVPTSEGEFVTLRAKNFNPDETRTYALGAFSVQAQAGDKKKTFDVTVKNDATLKISDYHPQVAENVCRNAAIDITFNKPLDTKDLDQRIKLFVEGGGDCFIGSELEVSGFFERFFKRLSGIFDGLKKEKARAQGRGFEECADHADIAVVPVWSNKGVIIKSKDSNKLIYPNKTYRVYVQGYFDEREDGLKSADGNFLWAVSPLGCSVNEEGGALAGIIVDETAVQCYFEFSTKKGARGTSDGGDATHLNDSALSNPQNDFWKDQELTIIKGNDKKNIGESRKIIASGTSGLTFGQPFPEAIGNTSEYLINNGGICALDFVSIIHARGLPGTPLTLVNSTARETVAAQGYSGAFRDYSQPINPDVSYSWFFDKWQKLPDSDIINVAPVDIPDDSPDAGKVEANLTAVPKAGNVQTGEVQVVVDVTLNSDSQKEIPVEPLFVKVRPCEDGSLVWEFEDRQFFNDLGVPTTSPYFPPAIWPQDGGPYMNFSFDYCREVKPNEVLPTLSQVAVPFDDESAREGLIKEYALRYINKSEDTTTFADHNPNDFFIIRVYRAPDYLVPTGGVEPLIQWFENVEKDFFKPEVVTSEPRADVDEYKAIQTDTAVYVHVFNVDPNPQSPKVYSNIYVLSINGSAKEETTRQIFKQLIDTWSFNTNLTDAYGERNGVAIEAFRQDYKRIRDLAFIADTLAKFAGAYPTLQNARGGGGVAVSTWGSEWLGVLDEPDQKNREAISLSDALGGVALPIDPDDPAVYKNLETCLKGGSGAPGDASALKTCFGNAQVPMQCVTQTDLESIPVAPVTAIQGFDATPPQKVLMTLGLGYGVPDSGGIVNLTASDISEVIACYDEEADKGEYYCRGASPSVYQYEVKDNGKAFTLYANMEYNKVCKTYTNGEDCNKVPLCFWDATVCKDTERLSWCLGRESETQCRGLVSKNGGSFCKWDDKANFEESDDECVLKQVAQPRCASAIDDKLCFSKAKDPCYDDTNCKWVDAFKICKPKESSDTGCFSKTQSDCGLDPDCEWINGCKPKEARDETSKESPFNVMVEP